MSILLIQVTGIVPFVVLFAAVLFVIFLVASAVRIVNEYERGVIFRLEGVMNFSLGR